MADKEYSSGAGCIEGLLTGVLTFFCIPILVGIWVLFDRLPLVAAICVVGAFALAIGLGLARARLRLRALILRSKG